MFEQFFPKEYLDSTYEIDFERRYAEGKRGIIFDIDNTLVPHGLPADQRALELFERLKSIGYQTVLLSNNKEPRVKSFAEQVDSLYIYADRKESGVVYRRPDLYGCLGGKKMRNRYDFSKADSSERRNSNCFEALLGKAGFVLL